VPEALSAAPRYALYAVPSPKSALAVFAAAWLGWDIECGEIVDPPERLELPADLHLSVTVEPRRYGFHGTLKAPFRLAAGASETQLIDAAAELAAGCGGLAPIPLRLAALGSFLALIPTEPAPALNALAAAAVERLDRFRAPLSEAELARRRQAPLTAAQEALLQRWGYPYVMEAFRYHMSLTNSLDPGLRERIAEALQPWVAPLVGAPLAIDDVALCVEPASATGFRVLRRFALSESDASGHI
jgi:putative phosphonate metabolism protein